jgi:translation initiation factor 3 subunit E
MADYDLTPVISQYLDKHLVIPLVEFLQTKEIFIPADILQRKLELLGTTNMLDLYIDVYRELHGDAPLPERS